MPSCAARTRCFHEWRLKLSPEIWQPGSLFPSIRSAPFPKGSTEMPSQPTGTAAAMSFIWLYDTPSGTMLRLTQELSMPVPLMQSRTPILV